MAEIAISQEEADLLIGLEKERIDDTRWSYPSLGGEVVIPLISVDKRENFILDISTGRIDIAKGTYQNRVRQVIVLVRLDFGGQPHRNPDGQEIHSPHLHIYREGYGVKWAFDIPAQIFKNVQDKWQMLDDFMRYCNITIPPIIERGLL